MNISRSTPVVVILVCAVLGAAGLFVYKNKTKTEVSVKTLPTSDLQKEFIAKSTSRLVSPAGKAWLSQDMQKIAQFFGPRLPAKSNLDFFQITNFIWDTQKLKISKDKEQELAAFQKQVVDFILSSEKSNSIMVSHYALRALQKMPQLCLECAGLIAKAYSTAKEASRKDQYFEYLLTSKEPPDFIKKEFFNLANKEENLRSVFSRLSQVTDESFKKEVAQHIFKRFKKMSNPGQGIALKFFVYNRSLIAVDLAEQVKLVSLRDDDLSQDAFLSSVQQLDLRVQYKSRIEEIAQRSPHMHIRSFAQSLLL